MAAVHLRLDMGRLLPLGVAADGVWLTERAAATELRRAARSLPSAAVGRLELSLSATGSPGVPAVPPPPSALPPGPLRIDGDFTALPGEPLPALAERLREVLFSCAVDQLGLVVAEVDLRVTALLETADDSSAAATPVEVPAVRPEGEPGLSVAAVPGVAHLTGILGLAVATHRGQVRVELATAAGHRPLDVARVVRETVTASVPGAPPVTVLITAVEVAT
jgi:hypothetical protein